MPLRSQFLEEKLGIKVDIVSEGAIKEDYYY